MSVSVTVLDREMYTEAAAARLLRLSQSTLHYWLEGGVRRGVHYKPVIRPEATGDRTVTWAEFIEASLLREYRRRHKIPMADLRTVIEHLRVRYDVPYPLAHQQPWVSGRSLIYELQEEVGLASEFCLVAIANQQFLMTPPGESFLSRVGWHDNIASTYRPHNEQDSPVVIDPDVRFGRPSVGGISTSVLWEDHEDGETVSELADVYHLQPWHVRMAIAYESTLHAA